MAALNDAATKAYRAKDYATFLDYEKRALALEPGNPRTIYNVDRLERSSVPISFMRPLFVADYTDGLWTLDLATKTKHRVDAPPDVWLGGMDGLSPVPGGFITVQIGVRPERVLRLHLDATHQHITRVDILEMNHPDYAGPIQGVARGRDFFYTANSQLSLADPHTGVNPADRARPTVILRLPF